MNTDTHLFKLFMMKNKGKYLVVNLCCVIIWVINKINWMPISCKLYYSEIQTNHLDGFQNRHWRDKVKICYFHIFLW